VVHYLRNEKNDTVVEVSVHGDDLSSSVNISVFAKEVLELHSDGRTEKLQDFIDGIDDLNEIRGGWWEHPNNSEKWDSIDAFVESVMRDYSKKLCLFYVTD
jgi:hypothetical protein